MKPEVNRGGGDSPHTATHRRGIYSPTLEQVRETLAKFSMVAPGQRAVVAVSGGPDSCALLLVLEALREDLGFDLHVAHLDHRLRSDSAADADFVREIAGKLQLSCHVAERDVTLIASDRKLSVEEAGRRARYDFFARLAREIPAQVIATGHTADDVAETVLMNLMRGAGIRGARGIPPVRWEQGFRVCRPLIEVSRAECEAYCKARGVVPRTDPTNEQLHYRRNRVRSELLPYLEREFNPRIRDSLLRLAASARDASSLLSELANLSLAEATLHASPGRLVLRLPVLKQQKRALVPWVLAEALVTLRGGEVNLTHDRLSEVVKMVERWSGGAPKAIEVPGGVTARFGRNTLTFESGSGTGLQGIGEGAIMRPPVIGYRLNVPGVTNLPDLEVEVRAELVQGQGTGWTAGAFEAWVDGEAAGETLWVRTPQPGERFKPLGMVGTKKVLEFLAERKVPAEDRARVPIIVNERHPVWVVGHRIDDRVKVTSRSHRLLHLCAREGAEEVMAGAAAV